MKFFLIFILASVAFSSWARLPDQETLLRQSREVNWDFAISESIVINAPPEVVWKYASDSSKAKEWSVYFDHISSLPGQYPDGKVGSLRRCYRNADETGEFWDEVTIEIEPLKSRKIVSYDFTNYPYQRVARHQYAFVRQLYRAIDDTHTEMTFQTIRPLNASLLWRFVFRITRDEVAEIFYLNLENIKAAIEGQPRLHPWDDSY